MSWGYGYYKYFNSSSAGNDFGRQILTSKVGNTKAKQNYNRD